MSTRRRTAADSRQHQPGPRTPADAPSRTPAGPPRTLPPGPAGTAGTPLSAAPVTASIRISRGNPTSEETAAVAALLIAALRRLHDSGPATAGPQIPRPPHRSRPTYRAPDSWAS
ncbi:acyl-CoA carboxylase epsilon subunit [Streptomyces sp. NPDC047017]|uniref:acyl-CoA carboxylase epsilon subunit n=1 Tax=Streptomyces sp. NPDC047017 TaxID=3155024 RepID=UPI0033C0E549